MPTHKKEKAIPHTDWFYPIKEIGRNRSQIIQKTTRENGEKFSINRKKVNTISNYVIAIPQKKDISSFKNNRRGPVP